MSNDNNKKRSSEKPVPKRREPTRPNDSGDDRPEGAREPGERSRHSREMHEEAIFTIEESKLTRLPTLQSKPESGVEDALEELKPKIDTIARKPDVSKLTSNEGELLKKYITLKEAETRDLLEQHRQYEQTLQKLASDKNKLKVRMKELLEEVSALKARDEASRRELIALRQRHEEENRIIKNDFEQRVQKVSQAEAQLTDLAGRKEAWKEKVKEDLKRIRLREKELENKYELLKRDMQTLLDSKDKHVLELKKKVDALELEMETLEERLSHGNRVLAAMDAKKQRLIQTLRLAITLLEEIDAPPTEEPEGDQ